MRAHTVLYKIHFKSISITKYKLHFQIVFQILLSITFEK